MESCLSFLSYLIINRILRRVHYIRHVYFYYYHWVDTFAFGIFNGFRMHFILSISEFVESKSDKKLFLIFVFLWQWKKKWNSSSILLLLQKLQILRFRGTFFYIYQIRLLKYWILHVLNIIVLLRDVFFILA